jgi:serine/threonine protein kinase
MHRPNGRLEHNQRQRVEELHCQYHVIHQDLKPDNIFPDKDLRPHLADFGFAKVQTGTSQSKYPDTIFYEAPELVAANPHTPSYDPTVDVHACGSTVYELSEQRPLTIFVRSQTVAADRFAPRALRAGNGPTFHTSQEPLKKWIDHLWAAEPRDRPAF